MRRYLWISAALFLTFHFLSAQNASSREWTIFRKGVAEYQKGNYELARQSFSLMISKLPNSALTTANYLMLAKTHYKMGEYTTALEQAAAFKRDFPNSSYTDDMSYLQANSYYRMDRVDRAVLQWLEVAFSGTDDRLRQKALEHADAAIRHKLKRDRVESLADEYTGTPQGAAFRYHLALNDKESGRLEKARNTLRLLAATPGSGLYGDRAKNLLDQMEGRAVSGSVSQPRIALLLPLSGPNAEVGKSMRSGIKLALDEHNAAAGQKLELREFDYETRLIPALRHMNSISADPSIVAVIGPLENDIAAACAALADHLGLALISPTASAGEITEISENAILLAPTIDAMATELGRFAFDSLRVRHAASLAPLDDYFVKMVEQFAGQAKADSASLIAQEWYYPGDQDFKKQFQSLKRIGLKLEFRDSVEQEYGVLSQQRLDSLYRAWRKTELERHKEEKVKIDSVDIPVNAYGALFLPVFSDDISLIAAQYAFANFNTQLLGNSDWYDEELLRRNRNYLDGMVFVSDGYMNEEGWEYKQFRNNFRNSLKTTPDHFALIGYDSFKFISRAFQNAGDISRSNMIDRITSLDRHNGIYRRFSVGDKRYNSGLFLLRYKFGQIIPVR